jgi:hypothetical protein
MLQDQPVALQAGTAKHWLKALDENGAQYLVLDRCTDTNLINLFRSQSGWKVDFEDEETVLFARADAV